MRCPFCAATDTLVLDSRQFDGGKQVRRRRKCQQCEKRFNSYEYPELKLPRIIKSDRRREEFNEDKLHNSIELAIRKRPVGSSSIDRVISSIMDKMLSYGKKEIAAKQLGILVMEQLRILDHVAYIRYASVYRGFQDIDSFLAEARNLLRELPGTDTAIQPDLFSDSGDQRG